MLADLVSHHVGSIPFENVDLLLGRGIDISPEAIAKKIIVEGRGGYCYEHNTLLANVLTATGFQVDFIAGRVLWGVPPETVLPRTHMALMVHARSERLLVDVGFGGLVPAAPLLLDDEAPQTTGHEPFRVIKNGGVRLLRAKLQDTWTTLYEFSVDPLKHVDFEPSNWFASTAPGSVFRNNLMLSRTPPSLRYTFRNGALAVRMKDGTSQRRTVRAYELASVFQLFQLPFDPNWPINWRPI